MKKDYLHKQTYPLLLLFIFITSCNGQDKTQLPKNSVSESKTIPVGQPQNNTPGADIALQIGKCIRCIFQDITGNFWFGTDGDGVCRYDGKTFTYFTVKEGLCSNVVWTIQEDKTGNPWFGTPDGVCRYDGKSFTTFTDKEGLRKRDVGSSFENKPENLWFGTRDGSYRYDGTSFTYLPLPLDDVDTKLRQAQPGFNLTAYSVYSILEDKTGNIWFGTEQRGVYRYDGKSLTNFTEEKGLSNHDFVRTLRGKPGNLARVWTIAEDKTGNLWFGTIDAGAWRYDGQSLTNFTIKDGLSSNAIWTIYKDRTGNLWFGTDGGGVCKYDGKSFINFTKNGPGK